MTRSNQTQDSLLRWKIGVDFSCAYSTQNDRVTEDLNRENWLNELNHGLNWFFPKQEHGTTIIRVESQKGLLRGDGLYTNRPGVGLGVWGSDCPGLCLVGPEGWRGVAHCGWRGSAAGLPVKLLFEMVKVSGHPPQSFEAFIGPGISGECYEVDQPVLTSSDWPSSSLTGDGERQNLCLSTAIEKQLVGEGVMRIQHSKICTFRDSRFHSYRRSGKGPNQILALYPKPSDSG